MSYQRGELMRGKVRFWTWENDGWVRLSLAEGQRLSWSRSWAHEEGWSAVYASWEREGGRVLFSHGSEGCDCDGRLSTEWDGELTVRELREDQQGKREPHEGMVCPPWREVRSGQRDYAAEAMGY